MKTFAHLPITALAFLVPALLEAQITSIDLGLEHVLGGGAGIERSCLVTGHSTGFSARLNYRTGRLWTVALVTRDYVIESGATCIDGFPPPDGTYIQDDRVPLLAAPFLTTDLRIRANYDSSASSPGLELGFGNAWRSSHDLPYGLLGFYGPIPIGQEVRLLVEAEYLLLRVTSDRYQRTWQNFQLVGIESLGLVHEWSGALAVGIGLQVAF